MPQDMREVYHEKSEVGGIADLLLFNIHEIIETPILLRIAEIELDLKAQAIVLDQLVRSQFQVGTEEHNAGRFEGF